MLSVPRYALWMLCAALIAAASSSQAASIPYGDFGPDFPSGITMYQDVTESSGTDPVPLYGAPTLSGDTLDFDPMSFVAMGTDGPSDITDGQLNFGVMVLEVNNMVAGGMTSLSITESGDYTLDGFGTMATRVRAGLSVDIDILEVDGSPITPISLFESGMITRDLDNDGPAMLAQWSNSLLIDFADVLNGNDIVFEFGVTKAEVVINDQLLADSEPESQAFIAKKDFTIDPSGPGNPNFEIPEPTSAALMMAAAACLALGRRRSAKAAC